jgi:4-hydroxybenzoate polyprenyltransferase
VPEDTSNLGSNNRSRAAGGVVAACLLLAALALIVLYTSRTAFLSPLSMVVVAAIGIAALLLQFRLRPQAVLAKASPRGSLLLTGLGVVFSIGAVFGDLIHLKPWFMVATALAAVVCFAISGIALLNALRKRLPLTPDTE